MARQIAAIVLLLAGGIALLAFNCEKARESEYGLEVEAIVETETIDLSTGEEPRVYSLVSITWEGVTSADGESVIVEKKKGLDFLIVDTLDIADAPTRFDDPDTLMPGETPAYRLVLQTQSKAMVIEILECRPFDALVFTVPDTVLPAVEEELFTLTWKPVGEEVTYHAALLTLESLAPLPEGEELESVDIEHQGSEQVSWKIDVSGLEPGNYILQVSASVVDSTWTRSIRGSRLFVLGVREEEVEEED